MKETTKEEKKLIEQRLKEIHLNDKDVFDLFKISSKVSYKPLKEYDNSNKVYRFVPVKDIDIYITPYTRFDEVEKKYKEAKPIQEYMDPNDEDNIETYVEFLQMLRRMDPDGIKRLEEEQKSFKKQIPYEVKYRDNFIWDIYYSEKDDKFFMMFPSQEENVDTLFYIIKKKIEANKGKKKEESIFVPINNMQPSYECLKKSELADYENYLWYFTGEWPEIYEVYDFEGNKSIKILGLTPAYDEVKSLYKITFNNKEEASEEFKLIKALFILSSSMEQEYEFKVALNEEARIDFFYNHNKITYQNLPEFIKSEIERKQDRINKVSQQIISEKERYELLKEGLQRKNEEYLAKERQIVTFLQCKKTFFGRISYFFKKKKVNKQVHEEKEEKKANKEKLEKYIFEQKELYTIEDLLKEGEFFEQKEKEFKNLLMDIKALEIKSENIDSKIKNATLYINEIESHKKSIFDFWKFTNKDEISMLTEADEDIEENEHPKIKKTFSYEDDMEEFGIKIDESQRNAFNEKETDAIFAIYQDTKSFNLLSKEKKLKKDDKEIEKILKIEKEQYKEDYDNIKEKDFDIFGSVVEDKTKIKTLNNNKHREIEKDKFRVLNITLDTELEEYKDIITNYNILLEESFGKQKSPYDISVYKISDSTIEDEKWTIMNIDSKKEMKKIKENDDNIVLNRINIKEDMPIIFYSNIMFYDNKNKTLPLGMDLSTDVLLDLKKYELKLISRKDFKYNIQINEFENVIKNICVYEYDIELKEEK